jgi:hypothetical protein
LNVIKKSEVDFDILEDRTLLGIALLVLVKVKLNNDDRYDE